MGSIAGRAARAALLGMPRGGAPARAAALFALWVLALAGCGGGERRVEPPPAAAPSAPSDAVASAIDAARDRLIEGEIARRAAAYLAVRPGGALVVGIHDRGRDRVFGHGAGPRGAEQPPGGDAIFEIGSVTKVFTGILLARLAAEGTVSLDDPIARFLPAIRFTAADPRGAITLRQLATHTSGLPRLPSNLAATAPPGALDPYAAYSRELLDADLAAVKLADPPGSRVGYSNYGAGLLGDLLARAAGESYADLLAERVTEPLGLADTRIALTEEQRARLVPGHAPGGAPTPPWNFDALAGAGALRSTADDLLRFLRANIIASAGAAGDLARALAVAHERHTPAGLPAIGLGWHAMDLGGRNVLWHNGGTGGYASFVAFDPAARTAVVVLSNHGDALLGRFDVDELGVAVLARLGEGARPVERAPAGTPGAPPPR